MFTRGEGCASPMRLVSSGIIAILAAVAMNAASGTSDDEDRIRAEIAGYLDAWNAGDAIALASHYAEDGDRANNRGDVFRGRAEILAHYEKVFATPLPPGGERRLAYHQVDVRIVSADAAVVDILYEVAGIRADLDSAVRGRTTVFMIERDGRWVRAAHRNSLPISPDCLKLCQAEALMSVNSESQRRGEDELAH